MLIDAGLGALRHELLEILTGAPEADEEAFVRIAAVYNEARHVLLRHKHLTGSAHPDGHAFYEADLRRRVRDFLSPVQCSAPDVSEARSAFIAQLRETSAERSELADEAAAVLAQIRDERAALLRKLGVAGARGLPTEYHSAISSMSSSSTRGKLAQVWREYGDRHRARLVAVVDRLAQAGRVAGNNGCGVEPEVVRWFVREHLEQSLVANSRLESEIQETIGPVERPTDHFEYATRTLFGAAPAPVFTADACLDFLFAVTWKVFGLTCERRDDDVIAVRVSDRSGAVGEILLDLWASPHKQVAANFTIGLRDRLSWRDRVQLPVAYVSCAFPPGKGLSFQGVHSLFHEFGHAVNQLATRTRMPTLSGIESLPSERGEVLSLWFEKWAYHNTFQDHMASFGVDPGAVARCVRIKFFEHRRTFLDRAVAIAVDLALHDGSTGVEAAFSRLDRELGISAHVELSDVLTALISPAHLANPGMAFIYAWGSAQACEAFGSSPEALAPSFDRSLPSEVPDPAATLRFFGALETTDQGTTAN